MNGRMMNGTSSLRTAIAPPKIIDPNNAQALINQPAFKVPVKSLNRLKEASCINRLYDNVGRDLLQPNMRWNQFIHNFMIQHKSMKQKAKDEGPNVPKLQKGTTLASWADLMRVFLSKVPSARGIATMVYVTRKEAQEPIVDPALATDKPHSIEHGLVEDEYGNRLLHSDVIF